MGAVLSVGAIEGAIQVVFPLFSYLFCNFLEVASITVLVYRTLDEFLSRVVDYLKTIEFCYDVCVKSFFSKKLTLEQAHSKFVKDIRKKTNELISCTQKRAEKIKAKAVKDLTRGKLSATEKKEVVRQAKQQFESFTQKLEEHFAKTRKKLIDSYDAIAAAY